MDALPAQESTFKAAVQFESFGKLFIIATNSLLQNSRFSN